MNRNELLLTALGLAAAFRAYELTRPPGEPPLIWDQIDNESLPPDTTKQLWHDMDGLGSVRLRLFEEELEAARTGKYGPLGDHWYQYFMKLKDKDGKPTPTSVRFDHPRFFLADLMGATQAQFQKEQIACNASFAQFMMARFAYGSHWPDELKRVVLWDAFEFAKPWVPRDVLSGHFSFGQSMVGDDGQVIFAGATAADAGFCARFCMVQHFVSFAGSQKWESIHQVAGELNLSGLWLLLNPSQQGLNSVGSAQALRRS